MRKTKFPVGGIAMLLLVATNIFYSCQKESSPKVQIESNQARQAVTKWIEGLGQPTHAGRAKWLSSLKAGLDISRAYIENGKGKQLIVIPVMESFKSSFDKGENKRTFLVLTTENNVVKRGNIVLFRPGNGNASLTGPMLASIISGGELNVDGTFTLLGIWDKFLYSVEIRDKNVSSVSTYESAPDKTQAASRTGSSCTGWYLVTRYYDSKGNLIHTDEVLVYIECADDYHWSPADPNCVDGGDNSAPDNSSGGSGGNSESDPCYSTFENLNFKFVSEKIGVTICGTAPNTRIKCYEWKVYVVSGGLLPMYFVSREQGVQSYNGRSWQFNSFTHREIVKKGMEILYSASVSQVSAISSLKKSGNITYFDLAQMSLSFAVKASLICGDIPIAFNDSGFTQCQWHVNE